MSAYATVKYSYRKTGTTNNNGTSWAGIVQQKSETMVMQELRKKHPGCEIELKDLQWK